MYWPAALPRQLIENQQTAPLRQAANGPPMVCALSSFRLEAKWVGPGWMNGSARRPEKRSRDQSVFFDGHRTTSRRCSNRGARCEGQWRSRGSSRRWGASSLISSLVQAASSLPTILLRIAHWRSTGPDPPSGTLAQKVLGQSEMTIGLRWGCSDFGTAAIGCQNRNPGISAQLKVSL
jgi:hypothetical protein